MEKYENSVYILFVDIYPLYLGSKQFQHDRNGRKYRHELVNEFMIEVNLELKLNWIIFDSI